MVKRRLKSGQTAVEIRPDGGRPYWSNGGRCCRSGQTTIKRLPNQLVKTLVKRKSGLLVKHWSRQSNTGQTAAESTGQTLVKRRSGLLIKHWSNGGRDCWSNTGQRTAWSHEILRAPRNRRFSKEQHFILHTPF